MSENSSLCQAAPSLLSSCPSERKMLATTVLSSNKQRWKSQTQTDRARLFHALSTFPRFTSIALLFLCLLLGYYYLISLLRQEQATVRATFHNKFSLIQFVLYAQHVESERHRHFHLICRRQAVLLWSPPQLLDPHRLSAAAPPAELCDVRLWLKNVSGDEGKSLCALTAVTCCVAVIITEWPGFRTTSLLQPWWNFGGSLGKDSNGRNPIIPMMFLFPSSSHTSLPDIPRSQVTLVQSVCIFTCVFFNESAASGILLQPCLHGRIHGS